MCLAESIARSAHAGQKDKGGHDYINHPAFVAGHVDTDEEKIVGWLHDVLEDTEVSSEYLREIFGDKILDALDAVTHRKKETWEDYISRVEKNPIAVKVKLADLTHNMDLSRLEKITDKDLKRLDKYKKTYDRLSAI